MREGRVYTVRTNWKRSEKGRPGLKRLNIGKKIVLSLHTQEKPRLCSTTSYSHAERWWKGNRVQKAYTVEDFEVHSLQSRMKE